MKVSSRKRSHSPRELLPPTKENFVRQRDAIIDLHRSGASGTRVSLALSKRMDSLLVGVFHSTQTPGKVHLSLVALGGYGRKELNFASDTDIMFLVGDERLKKETSPAVQRILHALLDYGLDIGHSFRTIEECAELAYADLDSWISVLEGRLICGHTPTFVKFRQVISRRIRGYDKKAFVQQLLAAAESRHQKYGSSTKLLEPNVKNSAGGLRDLHTVLWLLRGTGKAVFPLRGIPRATALSEMLGSPAMRPFLHAGGARDVERSVDFLLRARNEMHLQAGALRDTLEFSSQQQVAETLRYRPDSKRTSVERFMQDYYVAARSISEMTRRILHWASVHYQSRREEPASQRLDNLFFLKGNRIHLAKTRRTLKNEDVLVAFHHCVERGVSFSPELEDTVTRMLNSFTRLRTISETSLFRDVLTKPSGVSPALRKMNDLGLLGRWIPEWKGLVAFFQHNLYHFYTADEHTLMVLSNAESLQHSSSSFGEVFRSLPRRDTLYLACLFHDIAKPKRIGDHEVIGVKMTRTILQRLGYSDVLEDVLFLIRHHLLMEQVAFRRNLSDTQTILDFCAKFAHARQLDLLYILTYADLSAVNKNVWTDWKGMLLFELYRKSRTVLEGKMTHREFEAVETIRHKAAVEDLVSELAEAFSHDEAEDHLQAVNSPAYLAAFSTEEVMDHIRRIKEKESVTSTFKHQNDFTEVTLIARDAPFLLSRCCGVLSANDANIFDANIFTRNDGIVIDKFRVSDFVSKSILSADQCSKIQGELRDVLEGKTDTQELLRRHHMKWKRRTRQRNPNIRVDVEFEDHPYFTIIDVYAPDTLGFLYKVTEAISKLELNISFAKIATRVDGIVDSFYVQDITGGRLETTEERKSVKAELMKTIAELSESELVITSSS